jgi:hypothetical protein
MKKKLITFIITFVLLFSVGVSKVYAYDSDDCVGNNHYSKPDCVDGYEPYISKIDEEGFCVYSYYCVPKKTSSNSNKSSNSGSGKKKVKKKKTSKVGTVAVALGSSGVTGTFYRWRWDKTTTKLKEEGLITYDWFVENGGKYSPKTYATHLCANDPTLNGGKACRHNIDYWNLYYVVVGSKYYITYCINPSLSIKHKASVTQLTDLSGMYFTDTTLTAEQKAERIALTERLLLYGHNVSPDNNITAGTAVNRDHKNYLKMIAMQVLVYEIVEGGRTSFDTIEPNVWGGHDYTIPEYADEKVSMYNQIIKPNGGDKEDPTGTLYGYYKEAIENARLADQHNPATAFNEKNYTMSWDSLNEEYKVTIKGLGDYKQQCESDNNNVDIELDQTNGIITLTSDETIDNAKITCRFGRGNGSASNYETFRYFRFSSSGMQDMLYGSGYKIYEDYFYVSSENSNVLIKKVDADNKSLSGAKFKLTHMTTQDYTVNIDGNGSSQNLILSGKYRVRETTAPEGYDKISDFNVTINAKTHKITNCDGQKTDSTGTVVSCLNNQVGIVYKTNNTIELTIIDMPKNFKIIKVDKDGNPINGASFEIRDKNNNAVKFTSTAGGVYKYDTAGTVTTIYNKDLSSYPIALLPEGEYKIVETGAPSNYRLPADESSRTTLIKINANKELSVYDQTRKTYIPTATGTVKVVNYNTNINIHKTGNGKPLEGVQFELYNSDKTVKLKSVLGQPGRYAYTDDQSVADSDVYITNSTGDIYINNLPEGTYYLKEIATIEPYTLPAGDGVYTKVVIKVDSKGLSINGNYRLNTIEISNTPNSFNFYKRDPEGNSLTGGKYKLQKYDEKTKKYVDVKLVEVENDGTYLESSDIYKEDSKNGKIQFSLTKGVAVFIDMQPSTTYRIVEVEAPEGFSKVSLEDTATVYVDKNGNASGLLVLIDPPLPNDDNSAYAELIVTIQTGKERIMYAAVIIIVISIITGLIVYNKRNKE